MVQKNILIQYLTPQKLHYFILFPYKIYSVEKKYKAMKDSFDITKNR